MRWTPLGRDLTSSLTVWPYMMAYSYKILKFLFPNLTVHEVAVYCPVFFAFFGLLAFFLLTKDLLGQEVALLATTLLSTFPVSIFRTTAGFADRDSVCLLLNFLSFYIYIKTWQATRRRDKLLFSVGAGITMMLLSLCWEGVVLFIAIITLFNLMRLVTDNHDKVDCYIYIAWFLPVMIGSLLFTKAYRNFSQPFTVLSVLAPMGFVLLSYIHQLVKKRPRLFAFLTMGGRLTAGLSLVIVIFIITFVFLLVVDYVFEITDVVRTLMDNFLSPLGSTRLTMTIDELKKDTADKIIGSYGIVTFVLFSAGGLLCMRQIALSLNMNPWLSMLALEILLKVTFFSRLSSVPVYAGERLISVAIYLSAIFFFVAMICFLYLHARSRSLIEVRTQKLNMPILFLLTWYLIMSFCMRGANRFSFFFSAPALILVSYAIVELCKIINARGHVRVHIWCLTFSIVFLQIIALLSGLRFLFLFIGISILYVIVSVLCLRRLEKNSFLLRGVISIVLTTLFLFAFGENARRSYAMTSSSKIHTPYTLKTAFRWMKHNIPQDSVVAAWWDYGSMLNVLAQKATIIDEDQWIPYWIHLMARHVFCAQDKIESLKFLKTHKATHLLISLDDIARLRGISWMGADENLDILQSSYALKLERKVLVSPNTLSLDFRSTHRHWVYENLDIPFDTLDVPFEFEETRHVRIQALHLFVQQLPNNTHVIKSARITIQTEQGRALTFPINRVYYQDKLAIDRTTGLPGAVAVFPRRTRTGGTAWNAFYLPPKSEKSLMIQLYFAQEETPFFKLVYPVPENDDPNIVGIKIWKIEYPSYISGDQIYLKKKFPHTKLYRSWMHLPLY